MAYSDPNDPRARESRRRHYHANKGPYLERARAQRKKLKAYLEEYKSRPCEDCGVSYPYYVMDLDHRPGEVKLYDPAGLPTLGSWSKLHAEIAKCDLVCANCHRVRTWTRMMAIAE